MTRYILAALFSLFFINLTTAQISDDFEDGNLDGWGNTTDWMNSDIEPISGSRSLKHGLSGVAANSYIYRDLSSISLNAKSVTWQFNLKNGAWDPSGTSKFWFYLLANESDLNSLTVDGYAVGIDFVGTDDLLKIWKVTDGVAIEPAIVESSFNWNTSDLLGVSVTRTPAGLWSLKYQENGGFDNLINGGEANNTDYTFTDYCGLVFNLTNASRAGQLWLDDLTIDYDNEAPMVLSVNVLNGNTLTIHFSEQLDETIAETVGNYSVAGFGQPATANLNMDGTSIELVFATDFVENQNYSLTISNIEDISNNIMTETIEGFVYEPLKVEEIYVLSKNELIVEFSNALEQISAESAGNYIVNNGIGNPFTAVLVEDTLVRLTFTDFSNNSDYSINIANVDDAFGTTIATSNNDFFFHQVKAYDIVITELMPDPSPTVGLPEYEYLEIFNRTNYDLCLYNWKTKIGTTEKPFPLKKIVANSYMIICSPDAEAALGLFGETIAVLSNSDLTNAGKEVAIISNEEILIDSINYLANWYQDDDKNDGGWSLERIDPDNFCGKLSNWRASVALDGGTPGTLNSIDAENIDTEAPVLLQISPVSSTEVQLRFNEELDETNLGNINNYLLNGSTNPQYIDLIDNGTGAVVVVFENEFSEAIHDFRISNIADVCGNGITQFDTSFTYYPGNEFDVVINELMVDVTPTPNVLPASKYIELYNRSNFPINLKNWSIQIGDNSPVYFDDYNLAANDYLIICAEAELVTFDTYGNIIGILSESQLSITGNTISLISSNGELIDYIKYSNSWYGVEDKSNGGWSLERIDAENFCGNERNWKASEDYKGGTPGQANSVKAENPDTTPLTLINVNVLSSNKLLLGFAKELTGLTALNTVNYQLDDSSNLVQFVQFTDTSKRAVILQFEGNFTDAQEQEIQIGQLQDFCGKTINDTTATFTYFLISATNAYADAEKFVRVVFSEEVEIVSAQTTSNYQVSDGIGSPMVAYKHSERKNEVFLELPDEFVSGNSYTLNIENVTDLNGNAMKPIGLTFTYFVPSKNDVVINEVLFNPRTGGYDFVELYNTAAMAVDLNELSLARRNDEGELGSIKQLSEFNKMFEPGIFLAVSADTAKTKLDYPAASYERFLQIPVLPAYNDDEGTVVLLYGDSIIDEFSYNENMHFGLITDGEGVSLERIDPLKPGADEDNWHSAAETVGFGTPANQNSQFRQLSEGIDNDIKIEPETFSPDNDGYDDVVFIRYKFKEPGYVANVSVYDGKGRLVKRIANNELLATEGEFSWDGLYTNQTKARIGIYIIYFEVFNLKGEVEKTKKVCVLAGRLD